LGEGYINSYVYVGDVVAAAGMLACHPGAGGEIYHINDPVPLRDFAEEISLNFGRGEVRPVRPPLDRLCARLLRLTGRMGSFYNETVFSIDKLKRLGFLLPFGYKEGLRRTISHHVPSPISRLR
jgi:nucleoside-diphosphate-sugar epimerase